MINEYIYNHKGKRKKIELPIGEISRVSVVKTDLFFANFDPRTYQGMNFIADTNGKDKITFFSTRGAYKITNGEFPYIEVKGCGVPNKGISKEYFLEDGRDKDEIQDPIGGFSLNKAIIEWEMLEKLRNGGIQTHIPIALLKIREIKGPKGEDLALLVRTGKSNIRLSYLEDLVFEDIDLVKEETLYSVGKNLSLMHNRLGLCHNALHEENITLNGEVVDLEYASASTESNIYRDIWYGLLSFAEIFGAPLDISKFVEGYIGKRGSFIINGGEMLEMEESSKKSAERILNIQR